MTHELSHLIVEFYERLSSWEHGVVRDKGLTLPQMHTLEILGANGPMRMKELAGRMGVTTGTLTVMIDRLVKNGQVERRPHDTDRRSIIVALTESGRALFSEHDDLHLQLTEELTAGLSEGELEAFEATLRKMIREF
ncbi:MarR family winged helix-turn-helix transcriptional regulator [Desulfovibrio oxyclinae]|jgi:DNA-binding MarR family transcriptional regulator|uniref:MarR family winged helix-turn-helix transcriptional regulator n=1 Tax=Desulfovibrio oxyclinae TaxID=63560 RepID=UPI00036B7AF5|nr:MarR family transcriptional regulator [Desulfovibrio oxyclinae]